MLVQERAEVLGKYLTDNPERANAILELNPAEAVERINADGYDFTAAELEEFGKNLKAASEDNGELKENQLENVAGGLSVALAGFYFAVFTGCAKLGGYAAKNWKW